MAEKLPSYAAGVAVGAAVCALVAWPGEAAQQVLICLICLGASTVWLAASARRQPAATAVDPAMATAGAVEDVGGSDIHGLPNEVSDTPDLPNEELAGQATLLSLHAQGTPRVDQLTLRRAYNSYKVLDSTPIPKLSENPGVPSKPLPDDKLGPAMQQTLTTASTCAPSLGQPSLSRATSSSLTSSTQGVLSLGELPEMQASLSGGSGGVTSSAGTKVASAANSAAAAGGGGGGSARGTLAADGMCAPGPPPPSMSCDALVHNRASDALAMAPCSKEWATRLAIVDELALGCTANGALPMSPSEAVHSTQGASEPVTKACDRTRPGPVAAPGAAAPQQRGGSGGGGGGNFADGTPMADGELAPGLLLSDMDRDDLARNLHSASDALAMALRSEGWGTGPASVDELAEDCMAEGAPPMSPSEALHRMQDSSDLFAMACNAAGPRLGALKAALQGAVSGEGDAVPMSSEVGALSEDMVLDLLGRCDGELPPSSEGAMMELAFDSFVMALELGPQGGGLPMRRVPPPTTAMAKGSAAWRAPGTRPASGSCGVERTKRGGANAARE